MKTRKEMQTRCIDLVVLKRPDTWTERRGGYDFYRNVDILSHGMTHTLNLIKRRQILLDNHIILLQPDQMRPTIKKFKCWACFCHPYQIRPGAYSWSDNKVFYLIIFTNLILFCQKSLYLDQ